jgi:hypothetical protein
MLRALAFALIFSSALTSCQNKADVTVEKLDAELREVAISNYENLFAHCNKNGTKMLEQILAEEKQQFINLEKRYENTLAGVDLKIAFQDYTFALPNGVEKICGYPNRELRLSDFNRDKKTAQSGIAALKKYVKGREEKIALPKWLNAKDAAKFRALVVDLFWGTGDAGCTEYYYGSLPFTEEHDELLNIEKELGNSAYSHHFAIAYADYDLESRSIVFECAGPVKADVAQAEIAQSKKGYAEALKEIRMLAGI